MTFRGETIYQRDINDEIVTEEVTVGDVTEDVPVVAIKVKVDEDGNLVGDDLNVSYGNKFGYLGDYGSYGETPAKYGNEHDVYTYFGTDSIDLIKTRDLSPTNPDYKAYRQLVIDIASVYLGHDTDGSEIDEVWDTDSHKIFAIVDANYHKAIKDCIANFVEFRKDCIFFRDCNIGATGVKNVQDVYLNYILDNKFVKKFNAEYVQFFNGSFDSKIMAINNLRSSFIADYGTTYEIVDPISKKNIVVTMLIDLAIKLAYLYIEQGPFSPLAGVYNGFQLDNAIEGTINFVPIITPALNQKQVIDDLRLNYAIFEDEGTCVIQSNYTSQDKNTQLSFINNVLAIQEVARVVRTVCPKNRFRLITGSDMSEYATAVSRVLQGYNAYFDVLEFKYTQDPLRSIQKIFYASINFSFNNWAQTEIFDLYALANTTTTSVNS
jgi:hypothetical protein